MDYAALVARHRACFLSASGSAKEETRMTTKVIVIVAAGLAACAMLAMPHLATAQSNTTPSPAVTTPDKVESSIGTLARIIHQPSLHGER